MGLFEPGHEQQALGVLDMMEFDGKEQLMGRLAAGMRLREKLQELSGYKAFAVALARRYRPDLAAGLLGESAASAAPSEARGAEATLPASPAGEAPCACAGIEALPASSVSEALPPQGAAGLAVSPCRQSKSSCVMLSPPA